MLLAENLLRRKLSAGRNGGKSGVLMGTISYLAPYAELTCGYPSVGGEWILAKKDWQEARKRAKSQERRDKSRERKEKGREKYTQESSTSDSASAEDTPEPEYTPEMDEQRCILYLHGGKSQSKFVSRAGFVF